MIAGLQQLLGALARQDRPEVPRALVDPAVARVGSGPRLAARIAGGGVGLIAIAVAVLRPVPSHRIDGDAVPVETSPARRVPGDDVVDDGQRARDIRVPWRQYPKPGQFKEASIDHGTLVDGRSAVAQPVADRRIWVAGLGQPE